MNVVVKILMKRDGMTEQEAYDLVAEVREMILEAVERGDYEEAEEIFESELGLELDYLLDDGFLV